MFTGQGLYWKWKDNMPHLHWSAVEQKSKIPPPDRYVGEIGLSPTLFTKRELVFELQPLASPSERAKVAYVLSLLIKWARCWGMAEWACKPECCSSLKKFGEELTASLILQILKSKLPMLSLVSSEGHSWSEIILWNISRRWTRGHLLTLSNRTCQKRSRMLWLSTNIPIPRMVSWSVTLIGLNQPTPFTSNCLLIMQSRPQSATTPESLELMHWITPPFFWGEPGQGAIQ